MTVFLHQIQEYFTNMTMNRVMLKEENRQCPGGIHKHPLKACISSYQGAFVCSGIEELCSKRDELYKQILQEEEEKQKLQNDIRILTEKMAKVNESLAKKMATKNEFDRTIAETEAAYMKVSLRL